MSNFFSAVKNKVKPIEEDAMNIFPLTKAAGIKLSLTVLSSGEHIILNAAVEDASSSQITFVCHENAFLELEEYTGILSSDSESLIDIDRFETYYTEFKRNSHVDFHSHPVDVLIFLVNGSISMRLEDGSTTMFRKGYCFSIPKGLEHHFSFADEGAQCFELWKGKEFW